MTDLIKALVRMLAKAADSIARDRGQCDASPISRVRFFLVEQPLKPKV